MSAGKGSKPRPFSVDRETYNNNWDRIFKNNKTYDINNYQDILSTEDCILNAFDLEDVDRIGN